MTIKRTVNEFLIKFLQLLDIEKKRIFGVIWIEEFCSGYFNMGDSPCSAIVGFPILSIPPHICTPLY